MKTNADIELKSEKYAKVLFKIAQAENLTDMAGDELFSISEIFDKSPEVIDYLTSPVIKDSLKTDLILNVFKDKIHEILLNFLLILSENNDINLTKEIFAKYSDLSDIKHNVLKVKVTSAVEIKPYLKENLEKKLAEKYEKKIKPEYIIDKDIIAGIITEISGQKFDYSFKTRLKKIKDIRYEGTEK